MCSGPRNRSRFRDIVGPSSSCAQPLCGTLCPASGGCACARDSLHCNEDSCDCQMRAHLQTSGPRTDVRLCAVADEGEREASPEPEVSSEEELAVAEAAAEAAAAAEAERLAEQQLSKKVRLLSIYGSGSF